MAEYVLGIDQSTQGTKALLFDKNGALVCRTDLPHQQKVNELGWVEHDPMEIYQNVIQVVKHLVEKAQIDKNQIKVLGISNQRETAVAWNRTTGEPVYNAVVWQCGRGAAICEELKRDGCEEMIRRHTGLQLSPYFSAAKIAWILQNVAEAREEAERGNLCCGTMDSWLVYRLTGKKEFRTDYSNASRTQLFHIQRLAWDEEICRLFGIPVSCLAQVTDSDGEYGQTDFEGYLDHPIPIRGVFGDSHGALFGQGCLNRGMIKATYGTGSSIMMNIGETPVFSRRIVTSLGWKLDGKVSYVLEGNINYTGAVVSWLKKDLQLIASDSESQELAEEANPEDTAYLVPAFSGLGAPYWDSEARAALWGMSRTTGKAEVVKAALESIAYQITDVLKAMENASGIDVFELRVDGGPTKNWYLMQFQSDIAGVAVQVPPTEELSGMGAAYAAGITAGIYSKEKLFRQIPGKTFRPQMDAQMREKRYNGWQEAVHKVLTRN